MYDACMYNNSKDQEKKLFKAVGSLVSCISDNKEHVLTLCKVVLEPLAAVFA